MYVCTHLAFSFNHAKFLFLSLGFRDKKEGKGKKRKNGRTKRRERKKKKRSVMVLYTVYLSIDALLGMDDTIAGICTNLIMSDQKKKKKIGSMTR
jgi:hypothetical protein